MLALAPDLRRQMKEMTTTKRVLVVGAANVLLDEEAEVVEVANFSNVSQEHDAAMGTAQGVQDDEPIAVGEPSVRDLVKFGFIPSFCIFYYFSTSASFSILLISP